MVNGPPTPPPTTAAELQDEARVNPPTSQPAGSAPTPPPPPRQDSYQYIFPVIASLASQNNFEALIRTAEHNDLNGDGDRHPTRLLTTAPLVLAYLITDDLPPARFALTRLPDNLASLPLSKALLGLLACTWERKHAKVYSRSESLFNMVGQPDFFDANLATVIAGMVTTFVESFRNRTFARLSKAYASLSLANAQTYLGLSAAQLLAAAEENKWSYDASTQCLSSHPSTIQGSLRNSTGSVFSSLATFQFVADSVAKLEV